MRKRTSVEKEIVIKVEKNDDSLQDPGNETQHFDVDQKDFACDECEDVLGSKHALALHFKRLICLLSRYAQRNNL